MKSLFFVLMLISLVVIVLSSQFVTAQSPSLKFLSSSNYIDAADYFHVVGELQNISQDVLRFVQVIGTFYDASGRVVATDNTYTTPSDMAPGTKAPFDLTILSASVPVNQIRNYSLSATYNP
jgi:hypothetical protein